MNIRLMMLIETKEMRWVEVVGLAPHALVDAVEAELYVFSGEGGVATLSLANGQRMQVWRVQVWAICGWGEG